MLEGENLARHDPGQGTPGRGEKEDVKAHKSDTRFLRGHIVHDDYAIRILAGTQGSAHGHDELTDAHAHSAPEEQGTTAKLVHGPQSGNGGDNVDDRRNHLNDEGILDTRVQEVLRAVVEDEVDTRELLQSLEAHSGDLALDHVAAEAIQVADLAEAHLVLMVRADFGQL